ncbi:MAG: helix-turn-helix domain-containing protein [Bulleidia sp.]
MDRKKIGSFLKQLRKEKRITQETLAEKLNVSNRTVSCWGAGTDLPDIILLAEFWVVTISEIAEEERKADKSVNTEEMAMKMAEYSRNETQKEKDDRISSHGFSVFLIISALSVFPRGGSWGRIFPVSEQCF